MMSTDLVAIQASSFWKMFHFFEGKQNGNDCSYKSRVKKCTGK